MKVLIIAGGYPSEKYPMNGIFEFDQAKAIAELGNQVIFASVDMRSIRRKRKWGIETLEKDGVNIYGINLPLGRVPKYILSFFSSLGLSILYKRIEKEHGTPDIMHAHFAEIGYIATRLKKITRIPLVITEHSSGIMEEEINERLQKVARKTYPIADKIITVSPALKSVLKTKFDTDSLYMPNIVDTSIFKCVNKPKSREFQFIAVGNLIYRKRMDLTVQAFVNTFKEDKNVKLILIGEGPERKKIENIIKLNEFTDRVLLKGRLGRDAIAKYMQESDCFILASRAETFGVVYIEAMAAGLPVIATKCGGPEGFINDNNGLLIEKDNIEELAEAMKLMYADIDRYNKEEISKETISNFSPKGVGETISKVYLNLVERKHPDKEYDLRNN